MVLIFQFVHVVHHIDWFVNIEESLHPWDKAYLVMMYDLLNVLLDSDCKNFVKDFCIYVHQWYWTHGGAAWVEHPNPNPHLESNADTNVTANTPTSGLHIRRHNKPCFIN